MHNIFIPIAVPGSGKSTWCKDLMQSFDPTWETVYINADSVREKLYGNASIQGSGKEVFVEVHRQYKEAVSKTTPCNILVDNTNISVQARKPYIDMSIESGYNNNIILVWFEITLEEALKRNAGRERVVPEDVVRRMYANLEFPSEAEREHCILYRIGD